MGDILSLQPGDVLVIDRKAYEPLEFVMSGRTLLQGYLCSCQGRYALQICPRTKVKGSAT
jgi:flagellar motor switch/type III secretory pathway protein FliN